METAEDGTKVTLAAPRITILAGQQGIVMIGVRDVSSQYCQQKKGVTLQRLDHYDRDREAWEEVVVEDRNAGPAEIAATRIDFREWLRILSTMQKRAATKLAAGEKTGKVAKMLGVSSARISQLRRELLESWKRFLGEDALGRMLGDAAG